MNELGDLRPSQLIYTFGVGSLLDLPNTSALILGLDDWDTHYCTEISEERLLGAIQRRLGAQLKKLYLPPMIFDDDNRDPVAPAIGVPVAPFPRWLRCPVCDTLATIESGIFQLVQDRWRPDRTRYVHASCSKASSPTALPVRFLLACREGHLTDFPWVEYVHEQNPACKPSRLTLREFGAAGDASDIIVKCLECGKDRRMADAFDRDNFQIACSGHHPHLRKVETGCEEMARTILLGASNSWFPMVMSALSLPPRATDKLAVLIAEQWAALKDIPSLEVARFVTAPSRMPALVDFTAEQIWAAIETQKEAGSPDKAKETDLKVAEWEVLTQIPSPAPTKDFRVTPVPAPAGFAQFFEETILLELLREVRALLAFTRIESKGDFADADYVDDGRQTALSRQSPAWLPASEVRGEGILLRLKEDALQSWEQRPEVQNLEQEFFVAHKGWRRLRKQNPPEAGFPVRRIDQVLYDLVSTAKTRIVLVTFAAHRVRHLCAHLTEAVQRGVQLTLIVESEEESEGQLTRDAVEAFQNVPLARAKIYFWPIAQRERNAAGRPGKLHVKCAIVDDVAFIGSANLTEDAFNRNMELGILVREEATVFAIADHFQELIQCGVLVEVQQTAS